MKRKLSCDKSEISVTKENKILHAQVNQLKKLSTAVLTPKKRKSNKLKEYDVEKLVKHRGKKGCREFLVRWKGYSNKYLGKRS